MTTSGLGIGDQRGNGGIGHDRNLHGDRLWWDDDPAKGPGYEVAHDVTIRAGRYDFAFP